jgi:hypothetical protein
MVERKTTIRPFLPSRSRMVPRIKCPPKVAEEIKAITRAAGHVEVSCSGPAMLEDLFRRDTTEAVEDAVACLLSRKLFSTPIPKFRLMVRNKQLRKALKILEAELPDNDFEAPWAQMRAEYTGGDPFAEGLAGDGDTEKEDEWARLLHPRVLRQVAQTYLSLMASLEAKVGGSRPPEVPEQRFVEGLAQHWTEELGLTLKNGRGPGRQQQGAFAELVRTTLNFYRQLLQDDTIPDDIRKRLSVGPMDGHIRAVVDKSMRKAS